MRRNTYTKLMITKKMPKLLNTLVIALLSACSIAPGMHMSTQSSFKGDETVFIESLNKKLLIKDISLSNNVRKSNSYKIGNGDQISITVWGLPDIFPIANISPDQNLRRVDSNGNIYFPYVGIIEAANKTQNQLRIDLSNELSKYFNSPQLDISIARFNSQKVYLLGEVTKPTKLNITDIPLSLAEALGESNGLNTNTADGGQVFIIRQGVDSSDPEIYRANLSSPSGFISAGNFYLADNDIVYVNAKGTTRWNRVISQFFPFSSFLNSVDNLTSD